MANISSRIYALGTVAAIAGLGVASGVFGTFSPNLVPGQNCYGYGYHAGYGYGYECVPPGASTGGGGGGASTGGGTPIVINTGTTLPTPTVTLFPGFVSICGKEVKTLTDNRLDAYFDVLKIENRSDMNRQLTRAEFLKLVLNGAGVDVTGEADPVYKDVSTTHTLKQYISYATRHGIVSGQGEYFRPNDAISRGEATKILVNAANIPHSPDATTFSDVPTSYSLAIYVQTAKDNCIIHGVTATTFEPLRGITLSETAKVLKNIADSK